MVVRECVTLFTLSCLIDDEHKETLRDALTRLCVGLCPLDGPFAVVRITLIVFAGDAASA